MSFYENTLITKQDLPKTEIENIDSLVKQEIKRMKPFVMSK